MQSKDAGPATGAGAGNFPIAIIGAGFAGIGTAIQLKKAGIESFTMFERAGEIGGTWRDNTYPGAACDVPSHVYSFSFEQKADWTRAFAESWEIEKYLLDLVGKWKLREHLHLNTGIVDARFDESNGTWALRTNHGETHTARVVISGVGGLVDPAWPALEGLETFAGARFHTARWDHDYPLAGKRVGVIGTGASAIQVVPAIAPQVGRLKVFQRTPAWVMPKLDHVYSDREKDFYRRHPRVLDLSRKLQYWLSELFGPLVFLDNERLSRIAEAQSLRHLNNSVSNPELRRKLRPSFQFGCKRVLISNDYWRTFERDNVDLVTDGIERITPAGILTRDGVEHELDAIVCATGFALGLARAPFPVFGRGGKSLDDVWSRGAEAYKGMTVSGFPNWFILMGPNTGPGHTSVLIYTEAQIAHALQAIDKLRRERLRFVDIRQEVQDAYNADIQRRMKKMVWSSGCNSWYLGDDGSNHALYPGFAFRYVLSARTFNPGEYEVA
jgi:cation diffusion facilitator CzcD-associated flavoprotein CzcO